MSNAIRCINQRFAFKNSRISCLALIFKLKNPSTTVMYAKKSVAGGEIWRDIYRFFWAIDTKQRLSGYDWLQRVGWHRFDSGWHGFDSGWILKPSAAPRPFCVALSPSVHWHTRFLYHCCALYNLVFIGNRQWRSRADRVVNLNTTIPLALFWRTWNLALARTRPNVLAWHMGRYYSDCRASELTDRQVSGFVFSWFLENTEKRRPHRDFSKAHAPGCIIQILDGTYRSVVTQDISEFLTTKLWSTHFERRLELKCFSFAIFLHDVH